jgi:hypothetical protein
MLLLKNKSIPSMCRQRSLQTGKLDRDMDKGWQMSRDWVDNPDVEQRCQIVGDKMLTAMHNDNKKLLMLLAAYILSRVPGIKGIRIDTHGEMMESELVME